MIGVTVTLPHHISGHSPAGDPGCEGIDRPPLETGDTSPGITCGSTGHCLPSLFSSSALSLSLFCSGFSCFVLIYCVLFCFALRGWLLWDRQWEGVPWCRLPASASLLRAAQGHQLSMASSESTFCLLTDLVVLLVNVPAFPCKEQLA